VIFVSDDDVRRHVPFAQVLAAIERAFIALDDGRSTVFDVVRGTGGGGEHFFGIKSGRDGSIPVLGVKAGSYAPGNYARGLPSHTSTTLLIDDVTGHPIAVVEANHLNGLRTSAANALAVRCLAREDASTLGIIGIGGQAVFEALAVAHVRPIRRILAAGSSPARRKAFEEQIRQHLSVDLEFADAETCSREADILVTVTPARAPVVLNAWVKPGTHISAMGADNVGKQELEIDLVRRADCWVDHPEQSIRIGEMQHALRAGVVTLEGLRERTLGRLLRGKAATTRTADGVTVFDSSGLAIQDLAAAHAAVECMRAVSSDARSASA
jgi:alanine dehydrogenase